jgi:Ca2+-binding RTX toxin-like protein
MPKYVVKFGTDGHDTIFGTIADDWIEGLDGNDNILGGVGADFINGGPGIDDVAWYIDSPEGVYVTLGEEGAFTTAGHGHGGTAEGDLLVDVEGLVGSDFNDDLVGNSVANFLWGLEGDDGLYGYGGDDILHGDVGNDDLLGGDGADYIDGGSDFDTAWYTDSPVGIQVDLEAGQGWGGTAEGDTLISIEMVMGSSYDDHLVGNGSDNKLWGFSGNDTLKGGGGADQLYGSLGIDTASYVMSPEGVTVSLFNGLTQGGDAEGDTLSSIENLRGSNYADTLVGNNDANVLEGLGGKDQLKGAGGADTLVGGAGADQMTGGAGTDKFILGALADTGVTSATMDVIMDFNLAEGDKINLHAIDANGTIAGNQDFTFIGAANFSAPGQVRYSNNGVDTFIELNTDIIYIPDAEIRISGLHTPDANWFDVL